MSNITEKSYSETSGFIYYSIGEIIPISGISSILKSYVEHGMEFEIVDYSFTVTDAERHTILKTIADSTGYNFGQIQLVLDSLVNAYGFGKTIIQIRFPNNYAKTYGKNLPDTNGGKSVGNVLEDWYNAVDAWLNKTLPDPFRKAGESVSELLKGAGINISLNDMLIIGLIFFFLFYIYPKVKNA